MPIMRSRMLAYPPSQLLFALVTQREEGEHVAWRDQSMDPNSERSADSVYFCLHLFRQQRNRPQKAGYKPILLIYARFDVSHLATMKKYRKCKSHVPYMSIVLPMRRSIRGFIIPRPPAHLNFGRMVRSYSRLSGPKLRSNAPLKHIFCWRFLFFCGQWML